jgi:hypothetical protein
MKTVEVSLDSLRRLVEDFLKTDIHARAQRMVFTRAQITDLPAAMQHMNLVDEATAEAEVNERMRYKELLEAMESGNGIAEALTRFTG